MEEEITLEKYKVTKILNATSNNLSEKALKLG